MLEILSFVSMMKSVVTKTMVGLLKFVNDRRSDRMLAVYRVSVVLMYIITIGSSL